MTKGKMITNKPPTTEPVMMPRDGEASSVGWANGWLEGEFTLLLVTEGDVAHGNVDCFGWRVGGGVVLILACALVTNALHFFDRRKLHCMLVGSPCA